MADSILQEAIDVTTGERAATYGPPEVDYGRTAAIWSAILGHKVTAYQAALCMIGVKLSRLVNTPGHRDSHVDIAGYSDVAYRIDISEAEPNHHYTRTYKVPSSARNGTVYNVTYSSKTGWACDCPAHKYSPTVWCKHIIAVRGV